MATTRAPTISAAGRPTKSAGIVGMAPSIRVAKPVGRDQLAALSRPTAAAMLARPRMAVSTTTAAGAVGSDPSPLVIVGMKTRSATPKKPSRIAVFQQLPQRHERADYPPSAG